MAFDTLHLEKEMYGVSGKTFTQVLEELDPSDRYQGTRMEGLDAFERQLKRFDIKVSGRGSDRVEKFFSTSSSAALFPEYVRRAVVAGTGDQDLLSKIVASKTMIDSLDYRSITTVDDELDAKLLAEGAAIPATTIQTKENLVHLKKRGRMLVASYEALKFQKLDLFSVTLRQIGAQIAHQQLEDAVDVLLNGDGNQNPAASTTWAGSTLAYGDLLNLWSKFGDFSMNTLLCDRAQMAAILTLDEFKNPFTGLNFQNTGETATPFGAALYRTAAVPANTVIALDRGCALEMVCAGDVQLEYDKLIDRQLERAAITATAGFAKIYTGATQVLKKS